MAASLLHVALLVRLGKPHPSGLRSDSNAYLELAWNLWHHGVYGSRVSVEYPPVVPMVYAPLMAIGDNTARFTALYAVHAAVFVAASLLLLRPLTATVGRARAWATLAVLQLGGSVIVHGYLAQSEGVFLAVLLGAAAAVYAVVERASAPRWFALGAAATLAVATRRIGLVVPAAAALTVGTWLVSSRGAPESRRGLWALPLGLLAGWAPELVAQALHGDSLSAYAGGPVKGHITGGIWAFQSPRHLQRLLHFIGLHLAWSTLATAGAPLILGAGLIWRYEDRPRWGVALPAPSAALAAFAGLAWLGMTALSVLHVARYQFGSARRTGWDLYPRYVDPAEPLLVLAAVVVVGGLAASLDRRRTIAVWAAVAAAVGLLSYPLTTVRGGRLLGAKGFADLGFGDLSPAMLLLPLLALVALRAVLFVKHKPGLALALMLAASWCLSFRSPVARLRPSTFRPPAVLQHDLVAADPRAPLAVLVRKKTNFRRYYYEPGFRSDHPVDWVRSDDLRGWMNEHPTGFVLSHDKDTAPKLPVAAEVGDWRVHRASE